MSKKVKNLLKVIYRPKSKIDFILNLPYKTRLLDVGCGNNSPEYVKSLRPDIYYIGLDVGNYNQSKPEIADEYYVVEKNEFANKINEHRDVDAIISAHNIEHCDDPEQVLKNMLECINDGGLIYISFPCEDSVRFPKRCGTLNFYDDITHNHVPNWCKIINQFNVSGYQIIFARKRYKPIIPAILGYILEPISVKTKKILPYHITWSLYGFESIIWAKKF